jgi:hypothetical protein
MLTYILQENVLTDNILLVAEKGKIFKGGYIAIIREYVYQNSNSDRELEPKKFRSVNSLNKYLDKHYKDFEADFTGTTLDN